MEKDLIITLEDGQEYYVISVATYNNEKYAYLMNMKDNNHYIYVKEIRVDDIIKIEPIFDENIINKIVLYLQKEII